MRKLSCFVFLLFAGQFVKAQQIKALTGVVKEQSGTPVSGAGVILIAGTDTLKAVTDTAGKFTFANIKLSKIGLTVRSIGYIQYKHDYDLPKGKDVKLDPVILAEDSQTLQDVVIKGKIIPVRIKEDTLEYNALAYKTLPKDRAVELIKQLPGVQIDKDGNVKSMGKTLTKIRVNGKDFFTGDVKEFINKLPADLIAKVQMIDDYGDEARLTGIKTGNPVKILNLVTKENGNGGVFGNAQATLGTNKQYGLDGSANYWRGQKQMSFNANLNRQDNGAGKSSGNVAAVTYNKPLNKELNIITNYSYNGSNNDSKSINAVETNNGDNIIYNENNNTSTSGTQNHRLNAGILKRGKKEFITANIAGTFSENSNTGISQSLQTIKSKDTTGQTSKQDLYNNSSSKGRNPTLSAMLNYTRKLSKPGRTFAAVFNLASNLASSKDNLEDRLVYYDKKTGEVTKDSLLNRLLDKRNSNTDLKANFKFSEPLGKKDSIIQRNIDLTYDFGVTGTRNRLSTFAGAQGNVNLVDSLSNAYTTSFTDNSFNISYRYSNKRWRYTLGVVPRIMVLKGKYENIAEGIDRSTFAIGPAANINYNIARKHVFDFNISQTTAPPAFNQLQPVKETSNLQNIVIGNPNLKPSVNQVAMLNYTNVNVKDGSALQVGIMANLVQNKVVTKTLIITDSLGLRQESSYENTDGDYTINGQYSFSKPFVDNKYSLEMSGMLGYSNNVFYAEQIKGLNKSLNLSQNISLRMSRKWLMLNAGASYSLTSNKYSISYENGGNVQTWNFSSDARCMFGEWLNAGLEVYKTINTGFALSNSNPLLINMNMEKFLFNKKASIKISANDLLAQGNNQRRIVAGNTTTDTRTNQITRYFTMSFNMRLEQFGLSGS
ncbi:outer membrane beta-barrel protein [Pedobacter sp. MC2016-14]|uniref:outer membrane beta-barrel protein n=1 Tax=Pedobacter sp. MC2016-14 TaxID=2897327 RepID=UPI001E4B1F5C|nr:outer membrane beta-barrel protein [Pedobacter sp. MC2016-14]MCD0488213.1 outer membrane beta-barrel protein [Pedobacter sp. MC2016-14]